MKLSNLTAKLTCMKRNAVRILSVAALAGATLAVAVPAAQAQQFGVGVHIGGPYRPGPVFYGGYHDRFFEEQRLRHEEFRHDYYRYGWR